MIKSALLAAAVSVISLPAFAAQAPCTLTPANLKSPLNVSSRYLAQKGPVIKKRQSISQNVVLKQGQKVSYHAGGCEHYSYSFTYKDVPVDLAGIAAKNLQALAISLLEVTPVRLDKKSERTILIDGLKAGLTGTDYSQVVFNFPCGDATCNVNVVDNKDVVIDYSFAL